MSLLINGMDMPKCCDDCPFYDSAGFCALDPTREFEDYNHKRPDDCALVEIPTPHGDLIDRSELLNQYKPDPEEEHLMKTENPIAYQLMDKIADKVTESINSVKAIIEAED